MKDSFRRELQAQREEARSGAGSSTRRRYMYWEQLQFLLPRMDHRPQTTGDEDELLSWNYGFPKFRNMEQGYQIHHTQPKEGLYYSIVKKEHMREEVINGNDLPPRSSANVTIDGNTCILFGVKRIIVKFKNQTQLDLMNTNISLYDSVDMEESSCNEENTTLSLTFWRAVYKKRLTLRFLLVKSYYKLSVQNWYKLESLQILSNSTVQATFSSTKIFAPVSYSYHCQHVSSLQKYDALLVPSSADNRSRLWDVTFLDFQIQGFNIEEGIFSYATDCTTYFSPAILMGLVMSLILLLVLAYALHMLIHLKSMDRHYQRKCSATYFPKTKDNYLEDEMEPLRGCGKEFYELRQPEFCRLSIQHCASVSH
ncbi:V-type proton ATPase subunit S1-like protein isoform X2 [Hyperolius riggenbachi]